MRLIDADELRKTMYYEAFETDTDMQRWDSGCWIRYKMFENALENAPTIEAKSVRHGRWSSDCVCSECGEVPRSGMEENYCPNCGAKMIPTIPKEIIDAVLGEDEVEE